MEKIRLQSEESSEPAEFFVLDQTVLGGKTYLLVTDTEEGEGEAMVLRDDAPASSGESLYTVVEDDRELSAVLLLMQDTLEDLGIVLE